MKAVVAAFNQEKALVGAFSVITNIRMELIDTITGLHLGPCLAWSRGRDYGGDHCDQDQCAPHTEHYQLSPHCTHSVSGQLKDDYCLRSRPISYIS